MPVLRGSNFQFMRMRNGEKGVTIALRSIWNSNPLVNFVVCLWYARSNARTALVRRMDFAYGQQVLEEDYDENYEPTEEGTY